MWAGPVSLTNYDVSPNIKGPIKYFYLRFQFCFETLSGDRRSQNNNIDILKEVLPSPKLLSFSPLITLKVKLCCLIADIYWAMLSFTFLSFKMFLSIAHQVFDKMPETILVSQCGCELAPVLSMISC